MSVQLSAYYIRFINAVISWHIINNNILHQIKYLGPIAKKTPFFSAIVGWT